MNFFKGLWHWLTASNMRTTNKGHPDLYPLDVDKLTKELNLVAEAKRLGESRIPASDSMTLTGTEASVVQRVEKARQDYLDWAVLRLQVISQDLAKRDVTQAVNRARQADKEFERQASSLLTEKENILRMLGDTARNRLSELETFKSVNGLSRESEYPLPTSTFLKYSILVALVVLEGVLNAKFFAQGLSSGLLGGFSTAVIMALLNVGVAFSFGKFLIPNIFHKQFARKIVGFTSLFLAICLMIMIGLGIAHVRDSLTEELIDPAKAALQSLLINPFELVDFFSWVLFAISVVFGVISLFDGLFMDDLYPGYGFISRRSKSATDDYEDELSTLRSDLEGLKNEQLHTLDEEVKASQTLIAVIDSLIVDKNVAGARLTHALSDADNSLEALLRKFRTENELHRGEAPRPAYFDTKPELRLLPMPNFDTSADKNALEKQRKFVGLLLAEVQGLRASIQESFNQQFDRLKPLDTHFPRKESI